MDLRKIYGTWLQPDFQANAKAEVMYTMGGLQVGGVDHGRDASPGAHARARVGSRGSCGARQGRREEQEWCATDSMAVNDNVQEILGDPERTARGRLMMGK